MDHASIVRRGLLIAAVCHVMTNVAEYYVCRSSSLAATKLLCILSRLQHYILAFVFLYVLRLRYAMI